MPDASPTKWHRAHTTWFFETFLVQPNVPGYQGLRRALRVPVQFLLCRRRPAPRAPEARPDHAAGCRRGRRLSRACRCGGGKADRARRAPPRCPRSCASSKSASITRSSIRNCCSPTSCMPSRRTRPRPAYDANWQPPQARRAKDGYVELPEGIHTIGHQTDGYCFDNEGPSHRVLVGPVRIARALVTNGEWLAFMQGRRLRQSGAVALGRLGRGAERRLAGARPLAGARRRVAAAHARRPASRSIRPRR